MTGDGIGTADGSERCMGCHTGFWPDDTYWLTPDGPVDLITCADCAWQACTGDLDLTEETA